MWSSARVIIQRTLPKFLSKRIISLGRIYTRARRHKARIEFYGSEKPFIYRVSTEGVQFNISLDPVYNCQVDAEIHKTGVWENDLSRILKKYLQPGDVFLDIGANIGYHSLFVAAHLRDTGRVYAFEPLPRLAKQIESSIQSNGFSNVTVCNFGLAENNDDDRTIYIRDENTGGSSLFRYDHLENVRIKGLEKIKLRTLDSFLDSPRVALIKIDVEGYEFEVLKGAANVIAKTRPIIIVEFSPVFYSQQGGTKAEEILAFLECIGYKFFTIRETPIDVRAWLSTGDNIHSQIDIVCKFE